jgi:Zn-dependent M28 family amino/carboxypeptidase
MRRLVALMLATVPAAAIAQEAAPTIRPEQVRAHVAFLADDALEGRDAGTRGYDIAARYVATQYDALGLTPGGDKGGWYQDIRFQSARIDPAKPASVTIGGKQFAQGSDVLVTPDARYPTQALTAPAVFVGYGLDAPQYKATDYAGLDVRGKIVVMVRGTPKGIPSDVAATLSATKAEVAERHGAIGIVTLVTSDALKTYPWTRIVAQSSEPRTLMVEPDGKPRVRAPGIQARAIAAQTAAAALFTGTRSSFTAIDAAYQKKAALPRFALPGEITIAQSTAVSESRSPNVIGVLPGSDPALRGEYVLITAHLDHNGIHADAPGADKIFNGAMDNAAGVATMLEAARAFVLSGKAPKRSVMFAAVTSEEDGLLGSDYLARHPVVSAGSTVVANVNLDMPVLLYKLDDVVAFGAEHSEVGQAVARAAAANGLTLSPDFMPDENVFVRSDHYSFVKQGVPSVMLATGVKNDGERIFREFLAKTYHSPADQIDLPFNWESAAKFARVNYAIARDLADAPARPRWYTGSPFGDQFAPDQPKAPRPAN